MIKLSHKILLWIALTVTVPLSSRAVDKTDEIVRDRANAFNKFLLDAKYDEAVKFVDPDVVAAAGEKAVKEQFKQLMGFAKGVTALTGRKITDFKVKKIDLNKEKTEATLSVVFYTSSASPGGGGRQPGEPSDQKWVLKNKVWYFKPE